MAHFALQKLRILPSILADMDDRERAFVYASIQVRVEDEKKEQSKIKGRTVKKGGRR